MLGFVTSETARKMAADALGIGNNSVQRAQAINLCFLIGDLVEEHNRNNGSVIFGKPRPKRWWFFKREERMSDPLEADRIEELEKERDRLKAALKELLYAVKSSPDDFEVGEYETILTDAIVRAMVLL